jgi:hypothetical protein
MNEIIHHMDLPLDLSICFSKIFFKKNSLLHMLKLQNTYRFQSLKGV